jgi:WD40 repeat protein
VTALAMTPTGDQIVMAYEYDNEKTYEDEANGALRHCDLYRTREFSNLGETAGCVKHLTISADGRTVVTASEYGQLELWDLQQAARTNVIELEVELMPAPMAIAADRSWVVCGFSDSPNLELWDPHQEAKPPDAEMEVTAVAVDRDGDQVMWAELGGTCSVWAIGAEERPRVLETNLAKIDCLSFTPNGRGAVALEVTTTFLSDNGEVLASTCGVDWVPPDELRDLPWDVPVDQKGMAFPFSRFRSARFNLEMEGAIEFSNEYIVRGLAHFFGVSSDGVGIVFALNEDLLIWDSTQASDHLLESGSLEVTAAAIDSDGKFTLSARTGQPVKIWDAKSAEEIQTIVLQGESISSLCLTPDARYAVLCFAGGKLELRDLATNEPIAVFLADRALRNCAISADGKTITAASDANLHLFRLDMFTDSI